MSDTTNADEAPPSSASRRERGISAYAKILAVPEQEVPATFAARVGPAFAEEALQGRRGGRLAAQGLSGDRLATHLRLGRQHGLDQDALSALMTLLAGYIGYPRASFAMET